MGLSAIVSNKFRSGRASEKASHAGLADGGAMEDLGWVGKKDMAIWAWLLVRSAVRSAASTNHRGLRVEPCTL